MQPDAPQPYEVILSHRRTAWTRGDVARLMIREGGRTFGEASAATGLPLPQVRACMGSPRNATTRRRVLAVVEDGVTTRDGVASALSLSLRTAGHHLLALTKAGMLTRSRVDATDPYLYSPA